MGIVNLYSCSQAALYQVGRNVYESLTDNLGVFAGFKGKYVSGFVTDRKAEIDAAQALPSMQARSAQNEVDYIALVAQLGVCLSLWQNLKRYIADAYSEADEKARLEEAGQLRYGGARKNWDYANELLQDAKVFIGTHSVTLSANDNMPVGFGANFNTEKTTFDGLLTTFQQGVEAIREATSVKVTANNDVYTKLIDVCLDGQQIFKTNQAKKDQFVFETVLVIVSGPGSTGVKG